MKDIELTFFFNFICESTCFTCAKLMSFLHFVMVWLCFSYVVVAYWGTKMDVIIKMMWDIFNLSHVWSWLNWACIIEQLTRWFYCPCPMLKCVCNWDYLMCGIVRFFDLIIFDSFWFPVLIICLIGWMYALRKFLNLIVVFVKLVWLKIV